MICRSFYTKIQKICLKKKSITLLIKRKRGKKSVNFNEKNYGICLLTCGVAVSISSQMRHKEHGTTTWCNDYSWSTSFALDCLQLSLNMLYSGLKVIG